jgi:hypothetical protein
MKILPGQRCCHRGEYCWLAGLIVSGMVYLLRARSLNLTAERTAIEASC